MDVAERPIGLFTYGEPPERLVPPRRMRSMLAEGLMQGVDFLLFASADCDPATGMVEARRWRHGRFETASAPLPPLVVILSDPMLDEHRRIGAWIRARAEAIDDRGLDKLAQIRLLAASPLAGHVIPAERIEPERFEAQVADCVARWGAVVVKPVDGMRGGNIHFLLPAGDGQWSLRLSTRAVTGPLPDMIAALHARVAGRLRYRDFMVQRFVHSTFADMAFAIRADLAKSPSEAWEAIRLVARLGVTGALASNTAAGSAQMAFDRFLAFTGRDPAIGIAAERLALDAAALVDAHPEASMIEAGVDLALADDGSLTVIEVNARPESTSFEHDRAVRVIAYLRARFDRLQPPARSPK